MANENKDIIRAEFANDAAVSSGIIAGQVGFSLTSPYKMRHKEKGGSVRDYSSDAGDREQAGMVTITKTTEQLRLRWDAGNYTAFTVNNVGQLTIAPSGADVFVSGRTLITDTNAEQLRLRYDATNYATFTVNSSGDLTITSTTKIIRLPDTTLRFYDSNGALRGTLYPGLGDLYLTSETYDLTLTGAAAVNLFASGELLLWPSDSAGYGIRCDGKDHVGNAYAHGVTGHTRYLTIDEEGHVLVGANAT